MTTRILLVDDEPLVLLALGRLLRNRGFEVLTAEDGRGAMDLLERERVDLVLSDVCMPNMDGPALLHAMKAHTPPIDCPVIMLTGYGENSDHVLLALGAVAVVGKPVASAELLTVLERFRRKGATARRTP